MGTDREGERETQRERERKILREIIWRGMKMKMNVSGHDYARRFHWAGRDRKIHKEREDREKERERERKMKMNVGSGHNSALQAILGRG